MRFAILFITVWSTMHGYLAWRLLRPLPPDSRWRWTVGGLLGLSLVSVPAVFFGRLLVLHEPFIDRLAWFAYLDMGFVLTLVPLLVVRDTGLAIMRRTAALHRRLRGARRNSATTDPGRRRFLANGMNLGVIALAGAMTGAGYAEARRLAEIRRVVIPLAGLPPALEGLRIVQLSDIHLGPTIKGDYLQGLVERCNELQPDLVAVTGDLVDGLTSMMHDDVMPLTALRSRHGTYYVTGNHEYYWDALSWVDLLRTLGVHVLINEHRIIRHGSARLLLAGITDYSAARYVAQHAPDAQRARRGAGHADAAVLLAHQPKSAFGGAAAGYDLQLSGHIHGGQFFPWNLGIGLVQPFTTGLHRVDGRMWLYVSAGTGYWGPPNRLGVAPEITEIRLSAA